MEEEQLNLKKLKASRGYAKVVRQTLGALKNLKAAVEAWDPILLGILIRKLDLYSSRSYHLDRNEEQDPTVEDFLTYMERRALALENTDPRMDAAEGIVRSTASTSTTKGKVALTMARTAMECLYCPAA